MSDENKVLVVDCTDFNQNTPRNYKELDIHQAIPQTPITTFSRYEVLRESERRVYFDIDGVPEGEDVEQLPDRFVKAWAKFMKQQGFLEDENIRFVKTINHNSSTHEGFSSHIICYDYRMEMNALRNSVIMFVNTEEGKEFEPYVDTVVYSRIRLFKLPHFIGIPMNDINNFHELDPRDNDSTHYIVQYTKETELLRAKFRVPKTLRKKAKCTSEPNFQFYAQVAKHLDELTQVLIDKQKADRIYSVEELTKILIPLIRNEKLSEADKARLSRYIPINTEKAAIIVSLCRLVKQKYRLTDEELAKTAVNTASVNADSYSDDGDD